MTVQLSHITVTFPDGESTITPLRDINVELHPGELTAITGQSGSGKSTLLSVIAGLQKPTEGEVLIDATPLTEALRRQAIGLVFQQPNLLPALTVIEQLLITSHIRGEKLDRGAALDLLAQVGLADKADKKVQQLSGGQQQRVNIARALMGNPSVLLADEPTSALDPSLSDDIMQLIATAVHDRNLCGLVITHDHAQLHHADRTLILDHGVLAQPTPSQ